MTQEHNVEHFDRQIDIKGYQLIEVDHKTIWNAPSEPKYNIIALIDSGSVSTEANMFRFEVRQGMRLMLMHVMYTRPLQVSPDFHAWVLIVSDRFWLDVSMGIPVEMLERLFQWPTKYVADSSEWAMLANFMENIRLYEGLKDSPHSIEMVGAIFRCMLIAMAEFEFKAHPSSENPTYTMADTYLRKFVTLLDTNIKQQHEVSFYAEQLNITPKYLSEICKAKSGHKAKEIISEILIARIKREILYSGNSMKVIAYEYNFADQSSLGKFFRKMTGLSPIAFKRAHGLKDDF